MACGAQHQSDQKREMLGAIEQISEQFVTETESGGVVVSPDGRFFDKNPLLEDIAIRVLTTTPPSGVHDVSAARLRSKALKQTLYPQLLPSLALNEDGEAVARLGVSQIIFSNGQFKADKELLKAVEVEALASYLIEANERVAEAIDAYLDIHLFTQQAEVSKSLEGRYRRLVSQAEQRVSGGVAHGNEASSFQLRLLESRSDFQESINNKILAETQLAELTNGVDAPGFPPPIQLVDASSMPPEIVLSIAENGLAQGSLDVERARRRPSISIEAGANVDTLTGDFEEDASIGVGVSVPLRLRNNYDIEAAIADVEASEAALANSREDVETRLVQLYESIERNRARITPLTDLVHFSKKRVDEFDEQFLSGALSLEEAISILETYSRSKFSLIEAKNNIMRDQLEIAQINGLLIPG